jgi:CubicO group peptidase (beta-lactamase class C family)
MKAIKKLGLLICLIVLNIQTGFAQEATLTDSVKQFIEDSFRNFSYSNYSDWEGLAVSITYNDQYWSTIIGKANDTGIQIDEDGKWLFRSFTKLIISTVILQLHEEGQLDITEPLTVYLDPIQNVNMDDTIEDLLQMRSRTCRYLNSSSSVWIEVAQNPDAILDTKTMLEKHLPSGSCNTNQAYDYNDANFQILGLVIEAVTGKTGEEVLEERIFTPYQMNSSSLAPINLERNGFNGLYSGDFDDSNPHDQSEVSLNAALTSQKFSAGIMGSTKDMLRFLKHLLDGDILEQETLELMQTNPASSTYGMGLMIQTMSGMNGNIPIYDGTYFGHGGGGLNTSRTFYDPVRKIGFSYAYNSGSNTPQSDYNTEYFKEATYYYLRTCIEYGGCEPADEVPNEYDELAGELQQIMDENIPNYGIEGVATTIVFPNDEVHTIGSGYGQNVNDPVDLEKSWHWASGTKPMTGYVTLKLIEDGLLSIDDPVGKFLDTNSIPNLDSTITV